MLLLGGDESAGGRFPDEVPVTFIFLSPKHLIFWQTPMAHYVTPSSTRYT
jgi:hypothetical protein